MTRFCLLVVVFSLCGALAWGAAPEKKGTKTGEGIKPGEGSGLGFSSRRGPIDISSDTVEGNQKQNTVMFLGNVVAKQEDATLQTDKLVVYYDPDTRRLKEIVAFGNVKVLQADRRASSLKAIFNQEDNKIVLEGEAVILSLHDGIYYGLNSVGLRIWELIQQPRSLGSILPGH